MLTAASAVVSALVGVVLNHAILGTMFDPAGAIGTDAAARVAARPLPWLVVLVAYVVLLATSSFVQAMSVHIAMRDASARPATTAEAARFASGRMVPLLAWWLLAGVLVAIASIFLLVPGIYLGVVLFSSLTLVVLVERRGMGRSFSLIKGRFWATFGRLLLLLLIGGVGYGLASLIAHGLGGIVGGSLGTDIATVLVTVLAIPLGLLSTAFLIVTYTELRSHEDQTVTTDRLAEELAR